MSTLSVRTPFSLPLSAITVNTRRRPLQDVSLLTESIKPHGLYNPIVFTSEYVLVQGHHRLEACRQLGWVEIPVQIRDGDADDLELMEIDENLIRNELNVIERGEHFVRREALLARMGGRAPSHRPEKGETVSPLKTTAALAAELHVGERSLQQHRQIATKIDPVVRDMIRDLPVATHTRDLLTIARASQGDQRKIAAHLVVHPTANVLQAKTATRCAERLERFSLLGTPALPQQEGSWAIVLADPPWQYEHNPADSRAIENHYPTLSLEAICALPVPSICTPDAVLYLWATSPKLAEAMRVLEAWGFTYRTCFVWVKDKIGMGYWCRQQHELLLVGVRGNPPSPAPAARVSSVINAPRTGHSAKPEQVYGLIEQAYPDARRVELFARQPREGWSSWGNEVQMGSR